MKKSVKSEPLQQRVLRFIRENGLVEAGRPLVAAVSGGPDSVCLFHLLLRLREELGVELYIAHLDHCLRGEESAEDARHVGALAAEYGVPAFIEARDVREYSAGRHVSPEEAAREVRYAFLAEVAARVDAQGVATGHTADDNVETVLLHLIRGSGTRGLGGLRPASRWRDGGQGVSVIRPLLEVTRQETAAYCEEHGLGPRADSSNASLVPLRNRIRHQLVPLLEEFNPRIGEAFRRFARISLDDMAVLEAETERLWREIATIHKGAIALDRDKLLAEPAGLRRYLLRRAVEEIAGDILDIEAGHIEQMMACLGKQAGKAVQLPGGMVFLVEYGRFLLAGESASVCPFPEISGAAQLSVPGVTRLPGWQVLASVIPPEEMDEDAGGFTAFCDIDRLSQPLVVRRRQEGDRFQPLGMAQAKKIGRFMIDEKIPSRWRGRVPLVSMPEHVVWVAGWRIDDRVRVTADTREVLRLEFIRLPDD